MDRSDGKPGRIGSRLDPYLAAALALGFLLRLAPILWGVPLGPEVQSYHPDEPKAVAMVASFPEVYFSDARFLTYGTVVSYSLGAALLPLKALLVWWLDQRALYGVVAQLAARLLSVLLGTATIALTFHLARRLYDLRTARIAALLVSVSFYHALNSAVATLDVPMSFFVALNALLLVRAFERPKRVAFVWLGIASGLLAGTKLPGALFFGLPVLAVGLARVGWVQPGRVTPPDSWLSLLTVYALSGIGVFVAFHPHVLLDPGRYVGAYLAAKHVWVDRAQASSGGILAGWFDATRIAAGVPVVILSAVGVAYTVRVRNGLALLLAVFVAIQYVLWRHYLPPRFVIGVAPLLCLFAAVPCVYCISRSSLALRIAGTAAAALSISYALFTTATGVSLRWADPRPEAARYIERFVADGTRVALSSVSERFPWKIHSWRYPALDLSRLVESQLWEQPEVVITSSYALDRIETALRSEHMLDEMRWDPEADHAWYGYSPPTPRLFEFYAALLDPSVGDYTLERRFGVDVNIPIEFPPPEIRIYRRVAPNGGDASTGEVVARIDAERITLEELDASLQLRLHDLDAARYALRRRRLEALVLERAGSESSDAKPNVEILLAPPDPPRIDVPIGAAPVRGAPDAAVTIVEFVDFASPHSQRLQPILHEILARYPEEVRHVALDLPLPFHRDAYLAAGAAACAGEQGAYWGYHDVLLQEQPELAREHLEEYAERLGLDRPRFVACLDSSGFAHAIDADLRVAGTLGVRTVPTLFVNGIYLKSPRTYDEIARVVQGEVSRVPGSHPLPPSKPRAAVEFESTPDPLRNPIAVPPESLPAPEVVLDLKRSDVDRALADRGRLEGQLVLAPGVHDGRRLVALAKSDPGDLFDRLGLHVGDVILLVDGEWVTDAHNPLWLALETRPTVDLVVLRGPRRRVFRYAIQ